MTVFEPNQWILIGGGGPYLQKRTVDQDEYCLRATGTVNTAIPGDSVDVEFWFTPSDTAVPDTVRGTFKVWYRGKILPADWLPVQRRSLVPTWRWTRVGIRIPTPIAGPVRLTDLRGRICPIRSHSTPEGALVVPERKLAPGLYHLRWSGGGTTVLVPRE